MQNNRFSERTNFLRRGVLSAGAVAVVAGLASQPGLPGTAHAEGKKPKPMLMFVQLSEGFKHDEAAKTIRLVNVDPNTLYFADRPERIAGHIKMDLYLKEWTSKAGKDNFKNDPPNATLSVYEPGQDNTTAAVIEITDPKVEGHDLVYGYRLIEGKLPTLGEQTALFIDWIGVGGGVGFGYHGVGVGFRGPGLR
ncbi:hypothetical protein [Rhizobium mesoamericanum]|nr:hypothetical protein [Rhizobium mesoamericanum]